MAQAQLGKEAVSEIWNSSVLLKKIHFDREVSGQIIQVTITARVIWYSLKVHKAALGILKSKRRWPSEPNWSILSFLITSITFFTICQVFIFNVYFLALEKQLRCMKTNKVFRTLKFYYFTFQRSQERKYFRSTKTSIEHSASMENWVHWIT